MTTASFALFGGAYVCAMLGVPQAVFPLPALDIFRLHAHLPFMPAGYALGILPFIHGALLMMIVGQWFSKRGVRTLINETMRRTGIRLSLCFLANIAWSIAFTHIFGHSKAIIPLGMSFGAVIGNCGAPFRALFTL